MRIEISLPRDRLHDDVADDESGDLGVMPTGSGSGEAAAEDVVEETPAEPDEDAGE